MIFDSKYYPKIMYLAITVVSLLLLFNIVNITDQVKMNIEKKSITGFASEIDRTNNTLSNISKETIPTKAISNKTISSIQPKQEIYTTSSYAMYYVLIIGIIAAIFITFTILRSTILKNIKIEEESRRL